MAKTPNDINIYCEERPVSENKYGDLKDTNGRVGKYADQYQTLQIFVDDIWMRYRPFGGKCFFEEQGIYPVAGTTNLISKNKESKFFNRVVDNRYLTRDRYADLKQHYKPHK